MTRSDTQDTMPEAKDMTVQETAARMQEHYRETGSYRAQDLARVLGDPRQEVSGTVPAGYANSWQQPTYHSVSCTISSSDQT